MHTSESFVKAEICWNSTLGLNSSEVAQFLGGAVGGWLLVGLVEFSGQLEVLGHGICKQQTTGSSYAIRRDGI